MKATIDKKASNDLQEKYANLLTLLRDLGKIAVAYSGGVDSTFILAAAKQAPAEKVIALTMKQPYFADWELDEARAQIDELGVSHRIFEVPVDEKMKDNPYDRCYHCKSTTFKWFREEMENLGYDTLVDGTNADDSGEYRPGLRAVRENKVRSPLQETGFTKDEIRQLSREMGLPIWDKPSNTCLITRIPYNTPVSDEDLKQIENAELFIMKEGFKQVRVRKHKDIARIEVDPGMISQLVESDRINRIVPYLKSLGFSYISVDLEGYKTGSLDKAILNNSEKK